MRDTSFRTLDIGVEEKLREMTDACGEGELLEISMYVLDSLLGWCELCFNSKQEERDYDLLCRAYKILEKVHDNYNRYY